MYHIHTQKQLSSFWCEIFICLHLPENMSFDFMEKTESLMSIKFVAIILVMDFIFPNPVDVL